MSKKEKKAKHARDLQKQKEFDADLREILTEYPALDIDSICFAAPVYYPVALIKLIMDEKTFEEFDSIEAELLQFIDDIGPNADTIAEVMGLDASFVKKMIKILAGKELISEEGLTESGKESLENGVVISTKHTGQTFQMDAVNLKLLRLEEVLNEDDLKKRQDTDRSYGLLNCWHGISQDKLDAQLERIDIQEFVRTEKEVLPPNIISISEKCCEGIRYTKGYLLGCIYKDGNVEKERPVIFGKRKMISRKDGTEGRRYLRWIPFFVPDKVIRDLYQLPESVEESHSPMISTFYSDVRYLQKHEMFEIWDAENNERKQVDGFENTQRLYKQHLKANQIDVNSHIEFSMLDGDGFYRGMHVNLFSDTKIRNPVRILNWLRTLSTQKFIICSQLDWQGGIVVIRTQDDSLMLVCDLVKNNIEEHSFEEVKSYIEEMLPYKKDADSVEDIQQYQYTLADIAKVLGDNSIERYKREE